MSDYYDDHCPRCGKEATAHGRRDVVPTVMVVCLYCGAFNIYQEDLTQREMTDAELAEIAASPRMAGFLESAARLALTWRKAHL